MQRTLATKIITLAFILSGLALSGCGKKQDKERVSGAGRGVVGTTTTGGGTGGGAVPTGSASVNYKRGTWGEIVRADGDSQEYFQDEVGNLVSATLDPSAIGTVSGTSGDTTGVRFNGIIVVRNGVVDKANSKLRIAIWDSYAGTKEGTNVIPEYPIYFDKLTDYQFANNNTEVALKFEDSYGYVIFEGFVSGNIFEGQVVFKNHRSYDGSPADETEHILGRFIVETNGFFDIQK